jgi:XTP/dITP diphosphohydrolase
MTHSLVLASRNAAKIQELRRILAATQLDVVVSGPESFGELPEIAETGSSFVENALIKARTVAEHTGLPTVADDSGLCVDALNAMPGILSARWSGANASDASNLKLVLDQMADIPEGRRGAHFRCAAAIVIPDTSGAILDQRAVEGELAGSLLRAPVGVNGFGYDPIFQPEGKHETTAQMSAQEKDAISHRGRALRSLAAQLPALLGARG